MQAINARQKRLDAFFDRVRKGDIGDEIRADLAKFGAVQICGFVERSVEIVVLDRLTGRAHPRVVNFVKSHFKRGANYDCEGICQLLARFDSEWELKFRSFLQANDKLVDAMRSAYTLRNAIAHGGEASRGIAGVTDLYKDAKVIVQALVDSTE